jgi:5-methyltetrahydrofolate--homocysteine methyltransferase
MMAGYEDMSPMKENSVFTQLRELMARRILVLDGAMGTMLQAAELEPRDFGGEKYDGCNEVLSSTRSDVVLGVHRAYLEAGADIIETNTFGGTPIVLDEYGVAHRTLELNSLSAELAREAVDEFSTPDRPRFVAGSMGPTTKAISVTGGVTFLELVEAYADQARGLAEGGVDLFFVETCQDTRNAKAALIALEELFTELGECWPVVVSCTIEPTGTMLGGQAEDAFYASVMHAKPLAVGLNCATGPQFMTDHIRSLHELASCAVSCFPNAGLPDPDGNYDETPETLAAALERFADAGWLNIVGGCCGSTEKHIAAIAQMVQGKPPRAIPSDRPPRTFYSGIELVEPDDDNRPLLVGERTNVIGSAKFRRLVAEEKWDEAAEIGRRQVAGGAQIIDVCLQSTERDELADIGHFYERLIRSVKVPLMIDTTDPAAVELALTYSQGKAIINSINLEDGEERFQQVCPLLARYGAAVVVGTIDEDPVQAQAFTRLRKLEVARRSHWLLTERFGIAEADIIFDPLTFPVATGDAAYIGGAVETIEALKLIKEEFPSCKTTLGISNVSFGLPPAAREVVNSVFLYHCTKAGLDLAIVNTEKLERFASIPDDERELAEDLLFNRPHFEHQEPGTGERGTKNEKRKKTIPLPSRDPHDRDDEPGHSKLKIQNSKFIPEDWREQSPEQRAEINQHHIARLTEHFRGVTRETKPAEELPLDERLSRYIIDGTRDGLIADLETKLAEGGAPLAIINGPLMDGMAEVGRLFNANQLIVAEVLQSAESMKAAVSFLEGHMKAEETTSRGTVVLATVKGDVHDIGKNLVEIILRNNGYDVVNLGIKVPPEALVAACRDHRPDAVGLSGLLVKSAQQMVITAHDLEAAGIEVPILVGGAALSEGFTRQRIAPAYPGPVLYCADAMKGLDVMNRLMDPAGRESLMAEALAPAPEPQAAPAAPPAEAAAVRSSKISLEVDPIPAPDGIRHCEPRIADLGPIWDLINPQMLYGKHLGLRGGFEKKLAEDDRTAISLQRTINDLQDRVAGWMRVGAVWRFFDATSEGNTLTLYEPGADEALHSFTFPRQPKADGLCLADYVLPSSTEGRDSACLFVVGAGEGVRERAEQAKANGEYLTSHALQALALETAEAAAEWLHRRVRDAWGISDPPALTTKDLFKARYRGKRYSPGYPACPDLEDQAAIFELLRPAEIGVHLTDGMMMDPEASVSAIVFHHPDCSYFSAAGVRS